MFDSTDQNAAVSGCIATAIELGVPESLVLPVDSPVIGDKDTGKTPSTACDGGLQYRELPNWQHGCPREIWQHSDAAGCNVGCLLGIPDTQEPHRQFVALDVDYLAGMAEHRNRLLAALRCRLESDFGWRETWNYRGLVLLAIDDPGATAERNWIVTHAGEPVGKIQLLAHGRQAIVAGLHYSGNRIAWHFGGSTYPAPPIAAGAVPVLASFPDVLVLLESLFADLAAAGYRIESSGAGKSGDGTPIPDSDKAPGWLTVARLVAAIDQLPHPATLDRDGWTNVANYIAGTRRGIIANRGTTLLQDEEDQLADAVARWGARWEGWNDPKHAAKLGEHETPFSHDRAKWCRDWRDNGGTKCKGWLDLVAAAGGLGVDLAGDAAQQEFSGDVPPPGYGAAPDIAVQPFDDETRFTPSPNESQDHMAVEFARRHRDRLRYVKAWDQWLFWDGRRWEVDQTSRALNLSRLLCRDFANSSNGPPEWCRHLCSRAVIANVLALAGVDRAHATTAEVWDADPWLLNTPAGIVDLHTGKLMPPDPAQHMTKMTAAAPGGDCPLWRKFIAEVTQGDAALISYLQKLYGYALTGVMTEQAFFFFWGEGRNGKSVLSDTTAYVLGDYATAAPPDTFIQSQGERHPTELADLRGARLVTANETEQGRRWNVTRIKEFTGANSQTKIKARRMRQDFFAFVPQCKIVCLGNSKPRLGQVDQAIRDRFHLVPFLRYFAPEERDRDLPEKLKAEAAGILQWMIDGCLLWQAEGLQPPKSVVDVTTEYLDSEDMLAEWMDECCTTTAPQNATKPLECGSGKLFASYRNWTLAHRENPLSQKKWVADMAKHGFIVDRSTGRGSLFFGIALLAEESPVPGDLPG